MKINPTAAALAFIAIAIFWQSQNNKYAVERIDAKSFIKFNTRTGVVEDYCYLKDPIGCQKWDLARQKSDQETEKYVQDSYEKLKQETFQ